MTTPNRIGGRLVRFALPWSMVGAVFYPLRFGWNWNAAEHAALWSGSGILVSVLFGAISDWMAARERRAKASLSARGP